MTNQGTWQSRPEGGGRFAIWLIRSIARYGGRGLARPLLIPITLYFLCVRGPERRASRAYLSRIFGRPARLIEVARHLHVFASTILDRVFLLSGQLRDFDLEVRGLDELRALMHAGQGVLLFGSHHGSFEALRALSLENPQVRLRVLMDRGQNAVVTQMLESLCPDIATHVIDAAQEGSVIALAIRDALERGDLVALLVDRVRGEEIRTRLDFLGAPASFPGAPFLIAAAMKVPVVLCFGLYLGGRRYRLQFERFAARIELPRKERQTSLRHWQTRYVERLEQHVRSTPYNWFNFYDFWQNDPPRPPRHPLAAARADRSFADGTRNS